MEFVFTDHGRMRALERGVGGQEVASVLQSYQDECDGWIPGSVIRIGRTDGKRLAVPFFPGDPLFVHSVWWES